MDAFHVREQVIAAAEFPIAQIALVAAIVRVNGHVALLMLQATEFALAYVAFVSFLAGVHCVVARQQERLRELFITFITGQAVIAHRAVIERRCCIRCHAFVVAPIECSIVLVGLDLYVAAIRAGRDWHRTGH